MAIRFIKDYRVVGSSPPEIYTEGQIVKKLSERSEEHFIRRGLAESHHVPEYTEEQLDDMDAEQLTELAEEKGVMPESGSGKDGNVIKKDVLAALKEALL